MAVPPDKADALISRLHEEGAPQAAVIGEVSSPGSGRIEVAA